jgi:glycosyltransferase involved in cell wall biosynthesis
LLSNNIRDRTYLTGFVSGETKNLLIQGSNLFALTSHAENFGIAVLEALAVGVPVLLTSGVALASVVQQHQLGYVTQLDVSAIASAVEHYLIHPQQVQNYGDRARQLIMEQYTWDSIAQEMFLIYQKVINSQYL